MKIKEKEGMQSWMGGYLRLTKKRNLVLERENAKTERFAMCD